MNARDLVESVRKFKASAGNMPPPAVFTSLSGLLSAFLSEDANRRLPWPGEPADRYVRLLLTSFQDDFQIVVALWAPGSASPIHDHNGTVGAVSALVGETEETKYDVVSSVGGLTDLQPGPTITLSSGVITPILPDDTRQLHVMKNLSRTAWSATIHVYMDAIDEYGIYSQHASGRYIREPRTLWFDADEGWGLWASTAGRGSHSPRAATTVHAPNRSRPIGRR